MHRPDRRLRLTERPNALPGEGPIRCFQSSLAPVQPGGSDCTQFEDPDLD